MKPNRGHREKANGSGSEQGPLDAVGATLGLAPGAALTTGALRGTDLLLAGEVVAFLRATEAGTRAGAAARRVLAGASVVSSTTTGDARFPLRDIESKEETTGNDSCSVQQ